MNFLNALYSRFDAMLDAYGVYKVETIGDCYIVAGGLIREDEDGMAAVREGGSSDDPLHAERVFMFAKAMLSAAKEVLMPTTGQPVEIRIGIHMGPVLSGLVGTKMPRFCVLGETVTTASRIESTGQPGAVHASEVVYNRLRGYEGWEPGRGLEAAPNPQVKGKGRVGTYLWLPARLPDAATGMIIVGSLGLASGSSSGDEGGDGSPSQSSVQMVSLAPEAMAASFAKHAPATAAAAAVDTTGAAAGFASGGNSPAWTDASFGGFATAVGAAV
ncbi:hypothetical protein GPECTOR_18g79 [Gonium pectorale]|uniref:Guanylate cyclase domain-containing protein n=1 Tax=Gonium pectorale TaxID=33097 RepID=A0A150GJW0_GONPE|nr:hypothetical protein GPECTOR_18g79 [Gonium pectorale]|eukprot:KXZ50103.1 hypothetical protein GPECTOR_18g79 [Gonium pectorale]